MWWNIIKINIKTLTDAKRITRDYLPEELYNNMLISEEEYQKLSHDDKIKIHSKLYSFGTNFRDILANNSELKEKNAFHRKMLGRLKSKKTKYYTSIQPNEDSTKTLSGRLRRNDLRRNDWRRNQKSSTLIDNYFEMYMNQGKGKPTLEEIRREEGRPLTSDEQQAYYRRLNQ